MSAIVYTFSEALTRTLQDRSVPIQFGDRYVKILKEAGIKYWADLCEFEIKSENPLDKNEFMDIPGIGQDVGRILYCMREGLLWEADKHATWYAFTNTGLGQEYCILQMRLFGGHGFRTFDFADIPEEELAQIRSIGERKAKLIHELPQNEQYLESYKTAMHWFISKDLQRQEALVIKDRIKHLEEELNELNKD